MFINGKLRRVEAFPGISSNLPKPKLAIIKFLNNHLRKTWIRTYNKFDNLGSVFPKLVFLFQNRNNEDHHRVPHTPITLLAKFHFKQKKFLTFYSKFIKGISGVKEKKLTYHRILHIRISLSLDFDLKQTALTFCNKFVFPAKSRKNGITIKFNLYKLVYNPDKIIRLTVENQAKSDNCSKLWYLLFLNFWSQE